MSRTLAPFVLRAAAIVQGNSDCASRLTLYANRVKARIERDRHSMRGLLMALLAFDFPGHNANHCAGRVGASPRSSKTMAKTTTKTV
ncbi:hypothetical protein LJR234_001232 [Mesorhizobium amorphae]|uniref:hypothetical protein n=1 Tax=Mesorhizobium amorphae TaxID=71433 RepID=UPI003ECE6E91